MKPILLQQSHSVSNAENVKPLRKFAVLGRFILLLQPLFQFYIPKTSETSASSTSITSDERVPESVCDDHQDTLTEPNQSTNPSFVISSSSTTREPQSTASTEQSSVNAPQSSSESTSSQITSLEKSDTSSSSSSETIISTIPPQSETEPVGAKETLI